MVSQSCHLNHVIFLYFSGLGMMHKCMSKQNSFLSIITSFGITIMRLFYFFIFFLNILHLFACVDLEC